MDNFQPEWVASFTRISINGVDPINLRINTVLRNLILKTILKKNSRITAYNITETYLQEMESSRIKPLGTTVFMKLASDFPSREVGEGLPVCMCVTLGIAPIGIVNACDLRSVALEALDVASLSQWKERKETAMAIAAGVAEALRPNATVGSIIEAIPRNETNLKGFSLQ